MACLDELKQDVSDILDHLRNTVPCCGDIVIYGDSTVYITTIIPGVGEAPTHYGETEVAGWDEWQQYLCHNAHLWVDELAKQSNQLELALSVGGMSIGLAGFIVAAIVLFVVGGFLSGVVVMAIVAGTIAGYTANMFSTAADDIDAARDYIVCAIIQGSSLADAVEAAVSVTAWDLFYSHLDYDTAVAILYEGGDGETYLESEMRDDCCIITEGLELSQYPASLGTIVDDNHFSPEFSGARWQCSNIIIRHIVDPETYGVDMRLVSVGTVTGSPSAGKIYRCWNVAAELIYDSDTPPSDIVIRRMTVQSTGDFASTEIIWSLI